MANPPGRTVALPDEALDALIAVLDAVRHSDGLSRTEVAHRTGLGRAVVAQRVGELVDRGLITDDVTAPSAGGRPPRRLVPSVRRPPAGCRPGGDEHRRCDHRSRPERSSLIAQSRPTSPRAGAVLGRVEEHFADSMPTPAAPGPLWGVGVGIPGPVEFRPGRPDLAADHAGLGRLSDPRALRATCTARRSGSTTTSTSSRSVSGGRESPQGHDNVVFIKIGTGIGAGLISDRTAPPRRPGQRPATSATSRSSTTAASCAAAATWAASRRSRAARRSHGRDSRPRATGEPRCSAAALDQPGTRHRRGRRRAARHGDPVARRAAPGRRAAGRRHAREHRELLQSVADRHRRRRRGQRRPAAWPRSGRRSTAARCRLPRASSPSSARPSAGCGGVIGVGVDGRRPALRARIAWRAGSSSARRPGGPSRRRADACRLTR